MTTWSALCGVSSCPVFASLSPSLPLSWPQDMAISLLGASRQSALRHGSFGLRRGLHGSPSSWARSVLGIRAEDPKRIWERRTPLTPTHVQDLVQQDGIDVLIQPSAKRIFSDASYAQANRIIINDKMAGLM